MANFHENMLTIVADEENMMKVMRLFWENYESAAKATGFDHSWPDNPSLRDVWNTLGEYLDSWYEYAFCIDYLGSEGNQVIDEITTESGISVGISVAPIGRPYSETASVDLVASGRYYIFRMYYSTAWVSNFDDISDFMDRLPEGEYGIAFFEADEYDGYETISAEYYFWLGQGEAEGQDSFEIESSDLKARFDTLVASGIDNLDLLDRALAEGMKQCWNALRSYIDQDEDGNCPNEDKDLCGYESGYVDWDDPGDITLSKVWPDVLRKLAGFPVTTGVTGTLYQGREKNIETLVAGDELILRSDWESPYFSPVGIEAFARDGRSIGNLEDCGIYGDDFLGDEKRIAIALALPHIHAVVQEIDPLFMRRRNASYSRIEIRLDLDALNWGDLEREVEQMLSQSPAERVRESRLEGGERA